MGCCQSYDSLEQKTELNAYNKNDDNQLQEKDLSTNRPILPPNQEEIKETQSPINYPSILIHQVEDNNISNNNNNNNIIIEHNEFIKDDKPDNNNNEVQAKIHQLESQIRNASIQKVVEDKPYNPTFFKKEEPSVPNTKLSERLQKIKQRFKEKENELNNKVKINKSDNAIFQKAKLLENVLNKNQQNENIISNVSVNSSNVDIDEEEEEEQQQQQKNPIDIINNKPISKQKKKKPTKKNIFNNSSV